MSLIIAYQGAGDHPDSAKAEKGVLMDPRVLISNQKTFVGRLIWAEEKRALVGQKKNEHVLYHSFKALSVSPEFYQKRKEVSSYRIRE